LSLRLADVMRLVSLGKTTVSQQGYRRPAFPANFRGSNAGPKVL